MPGFSNTEFVHCPSKWGPEGRARLRFILPWSNSSSYEKPLATTATATATATATTKSTPRCKGVIVLIHGAGHNSLVWGRCAAGLAAKGFAVFAFDLRGHGDTNIGEHTLQAADGPARAVAAAAAAAASELQQQQQQDDEGEAEATSTGVRANTTAANSSSSSSSSSEFADSASDDCAGSVSLDLSMSVLVSDTYEVVAHVLGKFIDGPDKRVALIGHSLGGAIAVRTAEKYPAMVSSCTVVDLVEGTAMAALPFLKEFLTQRPRTFANRSAALSWALESGYIPNLRQSLDSFPSQLRSLQTVSDAVTAAAEGTHGGADFSASVSSIEPDVDDPLDRVGRGDSSGPVGQTRNRAGGLWSIYSDNDPVMWRTDLLATEPFWKGWYLGLSQAFLGLKVPKLLVVAGLDRLDTPLTIAHMNGQIQLNLAPQGAGHNIPEVAGDWLARTAGVFLDRHRPKAGALKPKQLHPRGPGGAADTQPMAVQDTSSLPQDAGLASMANLDDDAYASMLRQQMILSSATRAPGASHETLQSGLSATAGTDCRHVTHTKRSHPHRLNQHHGGARQQQRVRGDVPASLYQTIRPKPPAFNDTPAPQRAP